MSSIEYRKPLGQIIRSTGEESLVKGVTCRDEEYIFSKIVYDLFNAVYFSNGNKKQVALEKVGLQRLVDILKAFKCILKDERKLEKYKDSFVHNTSVADMKYELTALLIQFEWYLRLCDVEVITYKKLQ